METPPGKVIRSLRQALDMTQAEFARAAGWSASTISSWERGSTQPSRIAFKTILAFAEERGVRYQPKGESAAAPTPSPKSSDTLPVLRLGSRLPATPPTPLVARDTRREESFGSRRWTDLATYDLDAETDAHPARPSAAERFDARVASFDVDTANPNWHVEARLQLKIGNGTGLRRAGYVAASLAALVIGVGAGALLRNAGSQSVPRAVVEAPRTAKIDAPRVARPVRAEPPPVQVDELALAAVAAPALGQPPFAAAEPAPPPPAAKAEMPAPSMARLESIVALGGVRRASFRVGDRSISLVEGDEIGGRSVALIGNDEVTLVGGGVAARVRLGFDTAIE